MTNTDTITRINPTSWNTAFRYDQAQLRTMPAQLLMLAGQGAISNDGIPLPAGDMAAQIALAMDNVEQLLAAGGMALRDVLHMTIYVTDMAAALDAYSVITERLDRASATPPATLVGVTCLAIPTMMVEIAVSAGR